ncbi:MAG: hypothetical protein P8103_05725 [Candidatus Thiodiazotropha sp.]
MVLNKGAICWIAYGDLRGEAALDSIPSYMHARFNFNPLLKLAIGEQQLPSTSSILKRLYKQLKEDGSEQDQGIPTVSEVVSPAQDCAQGDGYEQDLVRAVLEREALEYLGPMAKLLCDDYLKSMPTRISQAQVHKLIAALAQDINDEHKGQLFKARVQTVMSI